MYREELTNLESVMRALIRAAGGCGTTVAYAAECASTAAQLWFDGEHEHLREQIPAMCRKIRDAQKMTRSRKTKEENDTLEKLDSPLLNAVRPAGCGTQAVESKEQGIRSVPIMFSCHGEADALIFASNYNDAVARFLGNFLDFITILSITNKTQE